MLHVLFENNVLHYFDHQDKGLVWSVFSFNQLAENLPIERYFLNIWISIIEKKLVLVTRERIPPG